MLRTELAELVVHGFQADGVALGFKAKWPMPPLSLSTSSLVQTSTAAKKWMAYVARVFVGDFTIEAFYLSDLWYSSTQKA